MDFSEKKMRILLLDDILTMDELKLVMSINKKNSSFADTLSIIQKASERKPIDEEFYSDFAYEDLFYLSTSIATKLGDVIISNEDFNDKEFETC